MLRFSLLTLLGVVLVAGIGSAALANPTVLWKQAVVTLAVLVLIVASLPAIVGRSRSPFSLGFIATGWLYFALCSNMFAMQDQLLTHELAYRLYALIHDDAVLSAARYNREIFVQTIRASTTEEAYRFFDFLDIFHAVFSLIFACLGGLFASWLGRRGDGGKTQAGE
jgi:hypothetical protein